MMKPIQGEGNGNPLQCSCLENPRNRGAWWAAVYGGHTESFLQPCFFLMMKLIHTHYLKNSDYIEKL